ncbi:unnamed protein product [Prorocentrum cordatum]|uniref:Uncharacterized protein n=1 Tax=Prorocentrum cordatum TaxID=2364126 RepID=A0ABN9XT00_9DINO|nr:unnamed protein product [Polarella glacialis]CAK0903132.1 unnamed protein product [Polarella glacialis]
MGINVRGASHAPDRCAASGAPQARGEPLRPALPREALQSLAFDVQALQLGFHATEGFVWAEGTEPRHLWAEGSGRTPMPTSAPRTRAPTDAPTPEPTSQPRTRMPTSAPTPAPPPPPPRTPAPTDAPTPMPTATPRTRMPTPGPTPAPTASPTPTPTAAPTSDEPTARPTPAPTAAPTPLPTTPRPTPAQTAAIDTPVASPSAFPSTPFPRGDHASSQNDPHVCALSGECFDIRAPSAYTLLRVPADAEAPDMLRLSADLGTDGVRPCGLFIKGLALSGSWLGEQVVRVRPYTRDASGSNSAGTAVRTNFSLQVGDSPWRSFTREDSGRQLAVAGRVAMRFAWREEYGQRIEAQALEFSVGGEGGRSALLSVAQASHQALNLDVWGLGHLGHARIAGALGTEGHPASVEEPTHECRLSRRSADPDAAAGQRRRTPEERASTLKVSWQ